MKWMKRMWNNVPGPVFHIGFLVTGIILHRFERWELFPEAWIGHAAGWPVIFAGVIPIAWAVWIIRHMDISTPVKLVSTGPYAFSRNPMYVAWTVIYLGIALAVNTLWPIIFLPAVLVATHYFAILHEERYLDRRFGEEYGKYKKRVRRYL